MDSKIFFKPRYIKEKYEKGYKGYRTLVLGVFHVCLCDCEFRDDCFKNTKKYDKECPEYKDRDEYYALSNSNEIEVESYLEECDSHYSYSYITKYFLRTNESVSENDKRKFWDSIAFTNFLQNMHGSYDTLKYKDNKKKFKDNLVAFKELLELLKPEVIYVISRAVKDCLCAKGNEINGLEFVDSYENWQVPVFRFTYKLNSKAEPQDILKEIEFKLTKENEKVVGNSYKIFLDKINAINDMTFSVKDRNIDKVDKVLCSYALDKKFVKFLEDYWHKKEIEKSLKVSLKKALKLEKDITLDIDEVITIINNNIPKYSATYMNDGVRIEFLKALNKELDKESKIKEFNFIRALGLECKSEDKWKNRRDEYGKQKKLYINKDEQIEIGTYLEDIIKESLLKIREAILNNKKCDINPNG